MKRITSILYFALSLIILMSTSTCDDDKGHAETVITSQMKKLAGKWKASSVTLDHAPMIGWDDFTISLSPVSSQEKLSYIVANNPYVTPWISAVTGSFTFDENDPENHLFREDGVHVQYEISEETLTMRFTHHINDIRGRVTGVGGDWEFTFEKVVD